MDSLPPVKPCVKCGAQERYESGGCAPCARAMTRRYRASGPVPKRQPGDPCPQCGSLERHADGRCAPCRRLARKQRGLDPTPCATCGRSGRRNSGQCKHCARRQAKRLVANRVPCGRCGGRDRHSNGRCKECKRRENAAWYARNAEESNERGKAWREANPERMSELNRLWRERNPDRNRALHARRRAREAAAPGVYTEADVRQRYEAQHGRCHWCQKKVGGDYHVDHVIALAQGGSNGPENICIACVRCNLSKGAKLPWEFQEGRLL